MKGSNWYRSLVDTHMMFSIYVLVLLIISCHSLDKKEQNYTKRHAYMKTDEMSPLFVNYFSCTDIYILYGNVVFIFNVFKFLIKCSVKRKRILLSGTLFTHV
jgi:hypothetical protein